MSLNFNFLKNENMTLYGLAKYIEENRSKSPEAVLTVATTFLDNIVYEIYRKSNIEYEEVASIQRVNVLENRQIISPQLADYLAKGFIERNKMHNKIESAEDYFMGNKHKANKLYSLVYKAAYSFYREFVDPAFTQTYKDPDMLKDIFSKQNRCPICASKTSPHSILCSQCNYDIELLDQINGMVKRIGFETNFSKKKMIEIGYDKSEAERLLIDLKNKELITKKGISYGFNREEILEYRRKMANYNEIKNLVLDITINDMQLSKIKTTDAYEKGSEGKEPFVNFYNSIFKQLSQDFKNAIQNKTYIEALEMDMIFSCEEFIKWCKENLDDETLFQQLKTQYLTFKKQCENDDCIKEGMYIDDEILNYLKSNETIQDSELEIKKENYVQALRVRKSYEDALSASGLTQKQVDEFRKADVEFRNDVDHELERRKNRFLKDLEIHGLKEAFRRSKLEREHLEAEATRQMKTEFYRQMIAILQENFLKSRREGKSARESIDQWDIPKDMYDKWLNNQSFTEKLNHLELDLLFDSIVKGDDLNTSLRLANISKRKFNTGVINAYRENETETIELYETMVLPAELEKFLNQFKSKNQKQALSSCKFDEELFNIALERNGEFAQKYLQCKKEKYISARFTNRHFQSLKISDLTEDEYKEHEEEILEEIDGLKFDIVLMEILKGKNTTQAAKKAGVKVEDIYEWYCKGQQRTDQYGEFAEIFESEYLKPRVMNMIIDEFDKKLFYRFLVDNNIISREEVKFWKRLRIVEKFHDGENISITA